jgi:hypothetical protein
MKIVALMMLALALQGARATVPCYTHLRLINAMIEDLIDPRYRVGTRPGWRDQLRREGIDLTHDEYIRVAHEIQDAILDYYITYWDVAPELRPRLAIDHLASRLGISRRNAESLLLRFNMDEGLDPGTGDGLRIYSRVQRDARQREHIGRLRMLQTRLLHESVEQIAQTLRAGGEQITAHELYLELFHYNVSIEALWRRALPPDRLQAVRASFGERGFPLPPELRTPLDIALYLKRQHRVSAHDMAERLGVGIEALQNILHYMGAEPHGRAWTGAEVQQLHNLYGFVSVRRLADLLQRSESSVSEKAGEAGLRQPKAEGVPNITRPPFGDVKVNGELQREPLEAYLWAHVGEQSAQIAADLDVSPQTVRLWKDKLGIHEPTGAVPARIDDPRLRNAPEDRQRRFQRYDDQRAVVDRFLDYWNTHHTLPGPEGWREIGINDQEYFFGTRKYLGRGLFSGREEAYLAIKQRAVARGIDFKMLDGIFRNTPITPMIRQEWQREAVDLYLDRFVAKGNVPPTPADYGSGDGKLGVTHARMFGVARYRPGGEEAESRIFNNQEDALFAIKRRAIERGIPFRILDLQKSETTELLRMEMRKEGVDLYLNWVRERGGPPKHEDWGKGAGQIGMTIGELYGNGNYRAGQPQHHNRLFDSQAEALLHLKEEGKKRGIDLRLLDIVTKDVTPEIRMIWQREAIDLYLKWWREQQGVPPASGDWGVEEGKVGLHDMRLFGQGGYAPDGPFRNTTIFPNKSEALLAIKKEAVRRGWNFRMLDVVVNGNQMTPEVRAEWQKEAAQVYIEFVKTHQRRPVDSDFVNKTVSLKRDDLYGQGSYRAGEKYYDVRIFDSRQAALDYIDGVAKQQGVTMPPR